MSSTVRVKDGPLPVTVIAGGKPFASVDLTDLVDIRLHGAADCDRLMAAAATAKRMLEMGGHPHGFERGAGMYGDACAHCGQQGKNPVHVAPCGDVAGHARVTCDLPAGHEGRHEHRPQGRPYIVWGPGVDEPAADAARDKACDATWQSGAGTTWYCTLDPAHDGRHRAMAGDTKCATWDDANGTEFPDGAAEIIAPGASGPPVAVAEDAPDVAAAIGGLTEAVVEAVNAPAMTAVESVRRSQEATSW